MNFGEWCICVWRDWSGSNGDDVFESCQWDFGEWVAVIEIQKLRFKELICGVCIEQVRVENHQRSCTE